MRIWQQSITDIEQLPQYKDTLKRHAERVCSPDTVVDVHGVLPGTYPPGVTPIEAIRYPWCHQLLSLQIVKAAVTAQEQGYDAVAISCFFDPGLREARSLVDIPVVSLCETAFLVASSVGRRYGLIGLGEEHVRYLHVLAEEYGATRSIAAVLPLEPALTEDDLDAVHGGGGDLEQRVADVAALAVAQGADLIIPAEGVLNTAMMRRGVRRLAGVPVIDAYGALLSYAEMLVRLQRTTGLQVSHAGAYLGPGRETAARFESITARVLGAEAVSR